MKKDTERNGLSKEKLMKSLNKNETPVKRKKSPLGEKAVAAGKSAKAEKAVAAGKSAKVEKVEYFDSFEKMSDIQFIKTILSYMCSQKEYEKAVEDINEVVDVSSLMNVDALSILFGSCSEKSSVFLRLAKKLFAFENEEPKKRKRFGDNHEEFFRKQIGNELTENICVAFLNEDGDIVFSKKYASGKTESINLEAQDIIKCAIKLGISQVAVAHNHPSGTLVCSSRDYNIIKALCLFLKPFKIELVGHYIVSPKGSSKTNSETFSLFQQR